MSSSSTRFDDDIAMMLNIDEKDFQAFLCAPATSLEMDEAENMLTFPILKGDVCQPIFINDYSCPPVIVEPPNDTQEESMMPLEERPCCSKDLPPLPEGWQDHLDEEKSNNCEKMEVEKEEKKPEKSVSVNKKEVADEVKIRRVEKEQYFIPKPVSKLNGVDPLFLTKFSCPFKFGQTQFIFLKDSEDENTRFAKLFDDFIFASGKFAENTKDFGLAKYYPEFTNAINVKYPMAWPMFTDVLFYSAKYLQWTPFVRLVLFFRCASNMKKIAIKKLWMNQDKLHKLMDGLLKIPIEDRVGFVLNAYVRRCCVKKADGRQCDNHKNLRNFFI